MKAFITGGNGDIGRAVVAKFRAKGYDVLAPGSQELDLASPSAIEAFFVKAPQAPDVFVHCAGFNDPKPLERLTDADIQKTLAIGTLSFVTLVQRFLPHFKRARGGHILGISSLYGSFARDRRAAYVMAKHALNGAVKTLAIELGAFDVKVNSLSPGFVDTRMTRKNNDEDTIRSLERRIPLGRLAKPEDIAEVACFLCSPENRYISGQDIVVDGAYSIGGFQNS